MSNHDVAAQIREGLVGLSREQAEELAHAIERLIDALSPIHIYAFGSHARGDATSDSDVDLFIVVTDSDEPAHRRAQMAYQAAGPRRLALDIVVMPQAEIEWRCGAQASLPATVSREGRLLYAA